MLLPYCDLFISQILRKTSNDSKLAYRYCIGLETGDLSDIEHLTIGPSNNARWITWSVRWMRAYASKHKLNSHHQEVIERMTIYIAKVYFKVRFSIVLIIWKMLNISIFQSKYFKFKNNITNIFCMYDHDPVC